MIELLSGLNHKETRLAVAAEKATMARLGCSPEVPASAFGRIEVIAGPSGEPFVKAIVTGDRERAEELGEMLVERLLDTGGSDILDRLAPSPCEK